MGATAAAESDLAVLGVKVVSDGLDLINSQLEELVRRSSRTETATQRMVGGVEKLNTSFISSVTAGNLLAKGIEKLTEIIYSGVKAIVSFAYESAMLVVKNQAAATSVEVVGRNAGYTAERVKAATEEIKKLGITTQDSQSILRTAFSAGMKNADEVAKSFARMGQDVAAGSDMSSSETATRLMHATVTAQPEMLRTLGILVSFEDTYKKYANEIGKSSAALTEQEKLQARLNVVLEQGKNFQGAYNESMLDAGKQLTSIPRYITEIREEFGALFSDSLSVAIFAFIGFLKDLKEEVKLFVGSKDDIESFSDTVSHGIEAIVFNFNLFVVAMKIAHATASTLFTLFITGVKGLGDIIGGLLSGNFAEFFGLIEETSQKISKLWSGVDKSAQNATKVIGLTERLEEAKAIRDSVSEIDKQIAGLTAERKAYTDEQSGATSKIVESFKDITTEINNTAKGYEKLRKHAADYLDTVKKASEQKLTSGLSNFKTAAESGVIDFSLAEGPMQDYFSVVEAAGIANIANLETEIQARRKIYDQVLKIAELEKDPKRSQQIKEKLESEKSAITELALKEGEAEIGIYKDKLSAAQKYYKTLEELEKHFADQLKQDTKTYQESLKNTQIFMEDFYKTSPEYKNMSDVDKYAFERKKLSQAYNDIMSVSTKNGSSEDFQNQIKSLEDLRKKYLDLRNMSKDGEGIGGISDSAIYNESLSQIEKINAAIEKTGAERIKADKEELDSIRQKKEQVAAYISELENVIGSLGVQLTNISNAFAFASLDLGVQRMYTLIGSVEDLQNSLNRVSATIAGIGAQIGDLNAQKAAVMPTQNQILGSNAIGSEYIPKTGLYVLHQGEKVKRDTESDSSGHSFDFSGMTIHTQSKDAESFAKELAPALKRQLARLG